MDEISSIKTFFLSHQVQLSTAWLEGCVSWCKEELGHTNYTLKELQLKVFEQWLLLDLRDVEIPCLPQDLSSKVKYILNGNYALQIMKVVDISKPKYWQLQRIRNSTAKNLEAEEQSSKRVLQLTLTDGVQEVEAMEYKPIPCLNLNLTPGIKIRLTGPVMMRRGRLMLESKNVKVLGGEVEELMISNAAENILATALKLPLNPNPHIIEESLLTANKEMFEETGLTTNITQNQNTSRNTISNASNSIMRNIPTNLHVDVPSTSINSFPSTRQIEMMDINEEEELRIAAEIDMLMEAERSTFLEGASNTRNTVNKAMTNQRNLTNARNTVLLSANKNCGAGEQRLSQNSLKRKRSRSKTPDLFDDEDFNDSVFENIDMPSTVIKTDSKPAETTSFSKSKDTEINNEVKQAPSCSKTINTSQLNKSLDFFDDIDIDAHLDQATVESKWQPSTAPKLILTIAKLTKNIPNIGNGKFRIKAKFNSVVEKLTVEDEEYYLVIKVEDETGDLNVKVHNDVVSDMAGCSPGVLMSLKSGILENDSDARQKVIEVLKSLKDKLMQLDHIIEVRVNSKENFPVIVNISW